MGRIKIDFPDNIIASLTIPVRITDINYGNHVGNDSFISIIHEARVQFLKQHHLSELNIGGAALIMGGLSIDFKNESFYGDTITIDISCGDISIVGFELYYRLSANRTDKHLILAIAKTDMVCFDYSNKKVVIIPESFLRILRG